MNTPFCGIIGYLHKCKIPRVISTGTLANRKELDMHPQYIPTEKDIQRFWSKVAITDDPNLCWEWTAGMDQRGYGGIKIGRRQCKAHRYSWLINYGELPDGLSVLHHCDNPKCVNPNHLFLGTQKDNMQDKMRKGRATGANGERSPRHKLTTIQVAEIRERNAQGVSRQQLSKEYGVTDRHIGKIVRMEQRRKS